MTIPSKGFCLPGNGLKPPGLDRKPTFFTLQHRIWTQFEQVGPFLASSSAQVNVGQERGAFPEDGS